MPVATYQGGRSSKRPSSTSQTSTNERNNERPKSHRTTFLPKPAFDEQLPEGVDFSEGGWATDFGLSLLGLLFFVSALQRDEQTFLCMFAGTAVAHFGGGLAHRFFPNRGSDGEGQAGFYACMVVGYAGNCLRYGMGWGLENEDEFGSTYTWLPYAALINWVYLAVMAGTTVCRMKRTNQRVDDSEGSCFLPDTLYAAGELAVASMEMATGVLYLIETNDGYVAVAVASNILGWLAVYVVGGCAFLCRRGYDPSLMQRIFHYALMVMIWALNEVAVKADQDLN